jgi:leucyl-tRNA synthetase
VRQNGPQRFFSLQEMIKDQSNLRNGPRTYHDKVFEEEVNDLINITKGHYEK